jgi:hypothetical protein
MGTDFLDVELVGRCLHPHLSRGEAASEMGHPVDCGFSIDMGFGGGAAAAYEFGYLREEICGASHGVE